MFKIKRFKNRHHAGMLLATRLRAYVGCSNGVVLALPRGGVPVGFAVAQELELPLDVMLVGKLGLPGQKEYAMGAVAIGGQYIIQSDIVKKLEISSAVIDELIRRKLEELSQRKKLYCTNHPSIDLNGCVVILVDDGLATGLTMLLALQTLRQANPARIVIAVPVAAQDSIRRIRSEADDVVCLFSPEQFSAVGVWYDDFKQVSDNEVLQLLDDAARLHKLRLKNAPDSKMIGSDLET